MTINTLQNAVWVHSKKKGCYITPTMPDIGVLSYTRVLQNTPWVLMGVCIHQQVYTNTIQDVNYSL